MSSHNSRATGKVDVAGNMPGSQKFVKIGVFYLHAVEMMGLYIVGTDFYNG